MIRVLYISYDGLLEPLGQSQVFQYLQKLSNIYDITLVSYEKSKDWEHVDVRTEMTERVRQSGIRWIALKYHKQPTGPATAYDIVVGFVVCLFLALRYQIQIVHARSYVSSVIALSLKLLFKPYFIFDMRGFWADERVDGGLWPVNSLRYKLAKWFEARFLTRSDVVISLTNSAVSLIKQFPYLKDYNKRFEVISTCTNLDLFYPGSEKNPENNNPFTLGYVGTASGWYIFDPVLECFKILKTLKPDARLLIVNRDEHSYIRERLNEYGILEDSVMIKTAPYGEVAEEIRRMDAGIFFSKPAFSQKARAPTKLGEFLGCGIPCLSNAGIGDMDAILESENVGVVLRDFKYHEQTIAIRKLLELTENADTRDRCVKVAHRLFSLQEGVQAYSRIYQSLVKISR